MSPSSFQAFSTKSGETKGGELCWAPFNTAKEALALQQAFHGRSIVVDERNKLGFAITPPLRVSYRKVRSHYCASSHLMLLHILGLTSSGVPRTTGAAVALTKRPRRQRAWGCGRARRAQRGLRAVMRDHTNAD